MINEIMYTVEKYSFRSANISESGHKTESRLGTIFSSHVLLNAP